MRERPILFSAPMVRAIWEDRKVQTRRVVKPLVGATGVRDVYHRPSGKFIGLHLPRGAGVGITEPFPCPYGAVGDRLWVRETWAQYMAMEIFTRRPWPVTAYRAGSPMLKPPEGAPTSSLPLDEWERVWSDDNLPKGERWRSPIHMPRAVSRITLEVTDVRVERLQAIDEADATAEGITDGGCLSCGNPEPCGCVDPQPSRVDSFAHLWMQINGPDAWDANPWVWVVTFKRIDA